MIVDDGSDESLTCEALYPDIPARTEILRLGENAGITAALNLGLSKLAIRKDFRFVARLDCGDVCTADRFVKQVAYLKAHRDIDLLGSWVRFEGANGRFGYLYRTPVELNAIRRGMHFRNLFIHPSVMWRASTLKRVSHYPSDLPHAEDYGFFFKLLRQGKAAILPEALVTCEINPDGLSVRHRKEQLKGRMKAVTRYRGNRVLGMLGVWKLRLLQLIPYRMALLVKSILY